MSLDLSPQLIDSELAAARDARQQGNEGKARVCARRAAGWAIALGFQDQFGAQATGNAFVLLAWLQRQSALSLELRQAAERLTVRINQDHELPHDQDPIDDAALIVAAMRQRDGA